MLIENNAEAVMCVAMNGKLSHMFRQVALLRPNKEKFNQF